MLFTRKLRNHFSAGVGRSGTFIALDCLMEQAEDAAVVDIMDCVAKLRHKRCYMVQTLVCGQSDIVCCALLPRMYTYT